MPIPTVAVSIAVGKATSQPPTADARVIFEMTGPAVVSGVIVEPDSVEVKLADDGTGTINLTPSPPGTAYRVTVRDAFNRAVVLGYATVPGAPCNLADILTTLPPLTVNGRDMYGGYPGLTGYAVDIKNAAGLALSFLRSLATQARSWALPDKDGTLLVDADIAHFVPDTRTVNGHALSTNVTVTQGDVGLGNVADLAPADMPVSTQQAAADAAVLLAAEQYANGGDAATLAAAEAYADNLLHPVPFNVTMTNWFNTLPTAIPGAPGVLWNNGGVLSQS